MLAEALYAQEEPEIVPSRGSTVANISDKVWLHFCWNSAEMNWSVVGWRANTWYTSDSVVNETMLLKRSDKQLSFSTICVKYAMPELMASMRDSWHVIKVWHMLNHV